MPTKQLFDTVHGVRLENGKHPTLRMFFIQIEVRCPYHPRSSEQADIALFLIFFPGLSELTAHDGFHCVLQGILAWSQLRDIEQSLCHIT